MKTFIARLVDLFNAPDRELELNLWNREMTVARRSSYQEEVNCTIPPQYSWIKV